jgi:hypothetical protein
MKITAKKWSTSASQGSAQGFNLVSTLGTLKINKFALKGREADLIKPASIAAPKLQCAIETG